MNIKKSTMAVAVSALIGLGVSGEAAANAYAGSYLEVDNLGLLITEDGLTPSSGVTVTRFDFSIQQVADLNGNGGFGSAACGGTAGTPSGSTNNCNPIANTGINTAGTVLDEGATNAPLGTATRANNDFSLFGPGTDQYSNSDSVIYTAQLVAPGITPTHTQQISESELQAPPTSPGDPTSESAASNSEIQSITGFTMAFTVSGDGDNELILDFDADPYLRAFIANETSASARASMEVTFKLEKFDNSGAKEGSVEWAPDGGLVAGDCSSDLAGVTCVEDNDDYDLQGQVGLTGNGDNTIDDPFGNFGITISGLTNTDEADEISGDTGFYSLTLFQKVSNGVARTTAVPEPTVLGFLGVGLLGLAGLRRRRRQV